MLGLGFVRRPTRGELKVIFFFAALACFCLGSLAIVLGIRAPAEKLALAHQAELYGSAFILVGAVFFICFWMLYRFSE
jgi:hypothetical protein